ncbi:MAG TPA: NAD(P)-dependent alcohol dehydrogenase [Steroidobacteraceae bacterium]|jgi:NADPH:quinone reductase-like Zn-dependent oxidoreductase|nr:NAD(P)-dependent alcohol dehydrogenase [Steroidobacteraceae bacterium]
MRLRKKILGSILLVLVVALSVFAYAISHNDPCPAPAGAMATGADSMAAVRYHCYGPASVLQFERVPKPVIEDDMLLVKVVASSVNPLEWHYMRGEPYIMRMQAGFGAPRDPHIGTDFSGIVEAVGKDVNDFKAGDEVFGGAGGAFGQYVRVRANGNVAHKPANVTHEEAGGVAVAAITALQALRDQGGLKAGQKVLINGASGGVGTYAVQIAKAMGANVTGVCSTRNVDMVASIGADRVLDYKNVDFTTRPERYDLIVDTVGNHGLRELEKVLDPAGKVVLVGSTSTNPWLGPLAAPLKAMAYGPFSDHEFKFFVAEFSQQDFAHLAELLGSGRIRTIIDRRYPLAQVQEAVAYVEEGHARGKVIIDVQ